MNNTNNYDRRDFDTRSRKSQALSGVTVNFIPRFIPNPAEHFAVGISIWSSIDFSNVYVDTNNKNIAWAFAVKRRDPI